ncbi:MAG: Hsp20/alpha crystallin family protein [Candidatus Omnitrophica bacterium]|nr:Hsp20/alpha crystallin family protein [Candidatus Omnitrophota bacterium]
MNRLFDFSLAKLPKDKDVIAPAVDVYEDNENIYVETDLPGFEQKDIKLSIKGDNLVISAGREEKKEIKKDNYHRLERFHGEFQRVVNLNKKIDSTKIKANYKNGVLKVILPKKEEEKSKEIEIKVE